jgi:hypothetical protein
MTTTDQASTLNLPGHSPTIHGSDAFFAINEEQELLRKEAYDAAVASRSLKPDPQRLESLEERARAKLRSHNIEPYDPVHNPDDEAREQIYHQARVTAEQQEHALQHAQAKVRELREETANLRPHEEPTLSKLLWLVIIVATAVLAGSVIPTICDLLSTR